MQAIEQLKEAEKQTLWDDGDAAETIEYLKISEDDLAPSHPQPRPARQVRSTSCNHSRWQRVATIIGGAYLIHALLGSGIILTNWWALLLLFPAIKNFQAVKEDRQYGIVNHQTKRHLKGGILATIFALLFLTSSWSLFWPALLIGWGVTQVLFHQWRNEMSMA